MSELKHPEAWRLQAAIAALERIEAAGRPHGQDCLGNPCECEQCEAWDYGKRTLAKLKAQPLNL